MVTKKSFRIGFLAACLLGATACSSDSTGDNTTGRRITLKTRIDGGTDAAQPFNTPLGWNVTLSKLYLATGAFYYFDGATIFSRTFIEQPSREESAPGLRRAVDAFDRFLGVRTAHAHPGHYIPGTARGEMLTASSVDLHAGPATLATGSGITGVTRSATFTFGAPASGPFAAELGAHAIVAEGIATKGSETRVFRVELDANDLLNAKKEPAIVGCLFKEVDMQADGTVTLAIKPGLWFAQVEFETMPASSDGKPVLMDPSVLARKELVLGVLAGDAYVFSYSK